MAINESASSKQSGAKDARPVLFVSRASLRKWKGEIRVDTLTLLVKYIAYHQRFDGTKPKEDELVDQALVLAFQRDDGFQKFLSNGGSKANVAPASSGPSGGVRGGGLEDLSQQS